MGLLLRFILGYGVIGSAGDSKSLSLGSSPSTLTMVYFKYKDKVYETPNIEKKLRRMKISINDIQILDISKPKSKKQIYFEDTEPDNSIIKHHFKLPNGYTITSIYDNLNHLNITDYERID